MTPIARRAARTSVGATDDSGQELSRRRVLRGAAAGLLLPPAARWGGSGSGSWDRLGGAWRQEDGQSDDASLSGSDLQSDDASPSDGSVARADVTVMTRNLYVGANLFRAFADSPDDVPAAVGSLLRDVRDSRFEARAEAIADEIATTRPDLVGLQEVALLRTQTPGDYEAEPGTTNATEVDVDFLAILSEKLAERRLSYEVVSSVTNVDIELPAAVDAGRVDVRLTDRDVILAHESVTTTNPRSATYEARLDLPFDDVTYPLLRGYCTVEVVVDGVAFTFANTHLESISASTQVEQARELLVTLSDHEEPVVLVGDFNSPADGGGTVTYDLLTRFFTDAYSEVRSDPGYTCCQIADLRDEEPRLGRRLDFVLYRGEGRTTAATRVGADPRDRVGTYVRGEYRRLWPSDHTGVVATLELRGSSAAADRESASDATATTGASTTDPTAGSTVEPTREASDPTETAETVQGATEPADATTTNVESPGFGVVSGLGALAGAVAAGVALARRHRRE